MNAAPAPVAYYCDHEDEPYDARTHVRSNAEGRSKPVGSIDTSISRSLSFGRYDYTTRSYLPPLCPRAVPLVPARKLRNPKDPLTPARHHPGRDTEIAAADLAHPKAGTLRDLVIRTLHEHPDGLTDAELAEETGKYLYSIAPRRAELLHLGWVDDSGRTRRSPRGVDAVVWVLSDSGRSAIDRP